jgi:hypothetical protein
LDHVAVASLNRAKRTSVAINLSELVMLPVSLVDHDPKQPFAAVGACAQQVS